MNLPGKLSGPNRAKQSPHYYRQVFLLKLLEMAGGSLGRTKLQKLLFLSQENLGFKDYAFIPLDYGCFSFQAESDLALLESSGFLKTNQGPEAVRLLIEPQAELRNEDEAILADTVRKFKRHSRENLTKHVYERYPYYAIKSKVAKELLGKESYREIQEVSDKIAKKSTAIFSIGYEGRSFEAYANLLIEKDVRLVCDLRRNPLSRKFGFSKGKFQELLERLKIEYRHIPELGIDSGMRRDLNAPQDYRALFASYRKAFRKETGSLQLLENLIKDYKRIALTCFEHDPDFCHRKYVGDYLENKLRKKVRHL